MSRFCLKCKLLNFDVVHGRTIPQCHANTPYIQITKPLYHSCPMFSEIENFAPKACDLIAAQLNPAFTPNDRLCGNCRFVVVRRPFKSPSLYCGCKANSKETNKQFLPHIRLRGTCQHFERARSVSIFKVNPAVHAALLEAAMLLLVYGMGGDVPAPDPWLLDYEAFNVETFLLRYEDMRRKCMVADTAASSKSSAMSCDAVHKRLQQAREFFFNKIDLHPMKVSVSPEMLHMFIERNVYSIALDDAARKECDQLIAELQRKAEA